MLPYKGQGLAYGSALAWRHVSHPHSCSKPLRDAIERPLRDVIVQRCWLKIRHIICVTIIRNFSLARDGESKWFQHTCAGSSLAFTGLAHRKHAGHSLREVHERANIHATDAETVAIVAVGLVDDSQLGGEARKNARSSNNKHARAPFRSGLLAACATLVFRMRKKNLKDSNITFDLQCQTEDPT